MLVEGLIRRLQEYGGVKELLNNNSSIVCNSIQEEALALAAAYKRKKQKIVIVKNNLYAAQRLYESLEGLVPQEESLFFPVDESFRMEALAASPELLTQRVYVLNKILEEESFILITHTAAMVRILPDVKLFKDNRVHLKVGDQISMDELVQKLGNLRYSRVNKIEHSLQFALRGGVIDVFSVNNEDPVRIEFFGDEIDSIRYFDLDSQRTIKQIKDVRIISATDLIINDEIYDNNLTKIESSFMGDEDKELELGFLKEKENYSVMYKYFAKLDKTSFLFEYLEDAHIIFSKFNDIKENYNVLVKEAFEYLEEKGQTDLILMHDLNRVCNYPNSVSYIKDFKEDVDDLSLPLGQVESANGNAKLVKTFVDDYTHRGYKIVFCVNNHHQIKCVQDWMSEWGYNLTYLKENEFPTNTYQYTDIGLKEGFILNREKVVYFSMKELFGVKNHSRRNYTRYKDGIEIKSYDNLKVGDYVVHDVHGIGQFLGIKTMEYDGVHKDYLHIGYRGSDVLYVPLEQFRLIRKYVSKEGAAPKLNKLGSEEWQKTKAKIKKRIADITDKLMELYSKRTEKIGYAFAKDDEWQYVFESSFPYELTKDQVQSIKEIKEDMEKPYPMDRILCGDVGFGKTEVAFVAAFKAILSGKQVALLCPTTLLAKQHYENALVRFQNFPINISMLSRFVTEKQQEISIERMKKGEVDLVIGTHRLLSKDVGFKDLGLLIVDEEQRFGVEHKERIKELKNSIDVLTLSATPIPRTFQMMLLGIRNLSQIETPPANRMPVQTYVVERNMRLVKEIIERELARNGQVFILHNRVNDIYALAEKIKNLVKEANVIVVHGQMSKDKIEDAMVAFNNEEANVMVCTSIIENGIDIPNANTIIVDDADKFGLSQLYQIKGRVGRGNRLGYAYLMYAPNKQLSEIATKRLKAIKEFAELGSGYRIAMRDLSIRGAGDILGAEQAGFIDTVGMDMYLHLLQEAIDEQKQVAKNEEIIPSKNLKVDAYIPERFTNDDLDKIDLYKKVSEVKNSDDLLKLQNEMQDIYGKLPISVNLLLEKRRFEIYSKSKYVEDVKESDKEYEIVLTEDASNFEGVGIELFRITSMISRKINMTYRGKRIRIRIPKNDEKWLEYANELFNQMLPMMEKYK